MLKQSFFVLILFVLSFVTIENAKAKQPSFQDVTRLPLRLETVFDGVRGCAVFYDPGMKTLEIYNEHMVKDQVPPQSTFKIVATLMGLENGVLKDQQSKMHYNGMKYRIDAWNNDVNLVQAFRFSCVWYYHQVVYSIDRPKIVQFLNKLRYGNEDVSQWLGNGSGDKSELSGFWLSSSLKISPLEQVRVLADIFEGKSDIQRKNISILKDIMQQKQKNIFAKTGSNLRGKSWFVGFVEQGEGSKSTRKYFAFYVDDAKGGVSEAKEIALRVLRKR